MAENKGGRDQDAVTGSGYFDKSLETLVGTPPPATIREIREQADSQQSASTADGDFED